MTDLLDASPSPVQSPDIAVEQGRHGRHLRLKEIIHFVEQGDLPAEEKTARRIALQKSQFTLHGNIPYHLDHKKGHHKRGAVPAHLTEQLLTENHSSLSVGHFGVKKTYGDLVCHWWLDGTYSDVVTFVTNCPKCTIVTGGGGHHHALLYPIPVSQLFQIVGVDTMELPQTNRGCVLVFQDFLTKWPLCIPYAGPEDSENSRENSRWSLPCSECLKPYCRTEEPISYLT